MDNKKSDYIINQINSIKGKVYEIAILTPLLLDDELLDVKPYTQYCVSIEGNRHLIDLYYPDLKIAIEIDEPHHLNQALDDEVREANIFNVHECSFKRIVIDENFNITNIINELKAYLLEKIGELKRKDTFKKWEIIEYPISQVLDDYPNVILYKSNALEFAPGFVPFSGPLQINGDIRKKANLFVAYSGTTSTVVNVYEINENTWVKGENGYYQTGFAVPDHPLLSSGDTKWQASTNRMYGKNLKMI